MHRTPPQSTSQTTFNLSMSPSTQTKATSTNVRKSAGEWEKITDKRAQLNSTYTQSHLSRPDKTTQSSSASCKPTKAQSDTPLDTTSEGRTPEQRNTRLKEAKKWVTIAKTHIGDSRNLKTEYKKGILQAIDQLYAIIKMGEGTMTTDGVTAAEKPIKSYEERNIEERLVAHGALLMNHTEEMKALKQIIENAIGGKGTEGKLSQEIGKLRTVTTEIGERVAQIKNVTPTYADTISRPKPNQAASRGPNHAVIVTSNSATENDDELMANVRNTLDAKNSGIQVQSVRKIKDNRIVVKCNNKTEMERTTTQLKKNNNLKIDEAKCRNPLILLKGVLAYNSDDDIKLAILNQNAQMVKDLPEEERTILVRYRRRARNPHENNVVIQVAPRLWRRLTEAGRVYIDLQSVRVEDQTPLVQCSLCLAYGHGKKHCTEQNELCHHCGGLHRSAECLDKKAGTQRTCVNCRKAKQSDDKHSVYSDECPIRRKWDALARMTTTYC